MRSMLLPAVALLAAACASTVDVQQLQCSTDLNCPSGAFCQAGKCVALPAAHDVTLDAPPPVTAGKSIKLSAHGSGGFTWMVQEAGGGTIDADGTYHAPATPGTYHLVATSTADPGKSASATIEVVSVPLQPALAAPAKATSGKAGLRASLTAPQASVTFAWTITGGTITSGDLTAASITFTAGTGAALQLSCTAKNKAGDVSAAGVANLALVAAPTAAFQAPVAVTRGRSGYVATAQLQAASTYGWALSGDPAATITDGQGTNAVTFHAGAGTSLTLSLRVINSVGDLDDVITAVPEVAPPVQSTVAGPSALHASAQAAYSVTVPISGLTYSWTVHGGTFSTGGTALGGAQATLVAGAPGPMTLTCTAQNAAGDRSSLDLPVTSVGPAVQPGSKLEFLDAAAVADGIATVRLRVTLLDLNGAPAFGESVTFSSSGTGNLFNNATGTSPGTSTLAGTTDAAGTFTAVLASTKAEAKTATAAFTGGVLTSTFPAQFNAGAPSSARSTLTAESTAPFVDAASGDLLHGLLLDAQGNPITGLKVCFFPTGSSSGARVPGAGTSDSLGQAQLLLTSTKAETFLIKLQLPGANNTCPTAAATPSPAFELALGPITFKAADAVSTSMVTAPSGSTVADNISLAGVQLALVDKFGNPVSNLAGVQVTVAGGTGNALVAGGTFGCPDAGAAPCGTTLTSDGSGTVAFALVSSSFGPKTVSVLVPKVTPAGAPVTLTGKLGFVGHVPTAANSTAVSSVASVPAQYAGASMLTVTLKDGSGGAGQPSGGYGVSVTANPFGVAFANATGTTDGSGVFSTALTGGIVGSWPLTIQVTLAGGGTLTLPQMPTLTVTPGDASASGTTVNAVPAKGTFADGTSVASIGVFLADGAHNQLPSTPVTITVTGASKINRAGQTYAPGADPNSITFPATSDGNGGIGFLVSATSIGDKAVTVVAPHASGGGTVTLTFLKVVNFIGLPARSHSTLSFSPAGPLVADGATGYAVKATLKDLADNLVGNVGVTFQPDPGGAVSAASLVTGNTTGTSFGTVTGTWSSNVVGAQQALRLDLSSLAWADEGSPPPPLPTVKADFVAGPPDPNNSSLLIAPQPAGATTVSTDGGAATVSILVKDKLGHPTSGAVICLGVTGTSASFTPALTGTSCSPQAGVTGALVTAQADGSLTYSLSSTKAEVKTVAFQTTGATAAFTKSGTVTFTAGALAQALFTGFSVGTPPIVADGVAVTQLGFKLRDANGNTITNQPTVSFSATPGMRVFFPAQQNTGDFVGGISVNVASSGYQAGTATISVQYGTVTVGTQSVSFTAPTFTPGGNGLYGGTTTSVYVDPTAAGVVYVATPSGPYKSTDAGASWSPINLGLEGGVLWAGGIGARVWAVRQSGTGAARSDDGGLTWVYRDFPSGVFAARLAIDPSNTNRVFTAGLSFSNGRSSTTRVSADGGATWSVPALPSVANTSQTQTFDVAFEPGNSQSVYLMSNDFEGNATSTLFALHSFDGGASFALGPSLACPNTNGYTSGFSFDTSPALPNPAVYFSCQPGGASSPVLYRSSDRLMTAQPVVTPAYYGTFLGAINDSGGLRLLSAWGPLYESRDQGQTWNQASTVDTGGQFYGSLGVAAVANSPLARDTVYVLRADSGLQRINGTSKPYSLSELVVGDPHAASIRCLRQDPTSTAVFASTPAGVFVNLDGKLRSWAMVGPSGVSTREASFSVAANGDLILGANGVGYRKPAVPPGSAWSPAMVPPTGVYGFDTVNASILELPSGHLIASAYDSTSNQQVFWRSTDFGQTSANWTKLGGGLPSIAWDPRAGTALYGLDRLNYSHALVSTDEASTWSTAYVSSVNQVSFFRFDGTNVWAVNSGTLVRSPLGAIGNALWMTAGTNFGYLTDFTVDLVNPGNLLAVINGGLQRSIDSGVTFKPQGSGVIADGYGDNNCSRMLSNGSVAAVGTAGHGLWVGPLP